MIGTLNRGPQVGAAVSYPHTLKKKKAHIQSDWFKINWLRNNVHLFLLLPVLLFCSYLCVVHSLSQSHRVDADIDVTTLVHQL